jgi:cyclophilin family peptidyl-prolyl cis-trans isomerase/HEAT repeat protein
VLPVPCREALIAAAYDPSDEVRSRVIEALGRSGSPEIAETIGPILVERVPGGATSLPWGEDVERSALRLPHPVLRFGLFALVKDQNLRWAWNVLATEDSHPRFLWWPAAWSASRFEAAEITPLLLEYVGTSDPYYRQLGAKGLARMPVEHSRSAVAELLNDPEEKVRIEATRAAASLRLEEAVPKLLDLMNAGTPYERVEATLALAFIPDPTTIEILIDTLTDPSPWIRAAVLRALYYQDSETFWLLRSGMDDDPDWTVRVDQARLMGEVASPRSIGLLEQMVSDRDFRVRPHVFHALAEANPERAKPILIDHLDAEDVFERAAAAASLGMLRADGAATPLRAAFQATSKNEDPAARLAILTALEVFGADAVETDARKALSDPAWIVRKKAQDILRGLGDMEAQATEVGSGRFLNDYMRLLRPQFTPHAYIRTEKGAIEVELFVLDAPLTVDNFIRLARRGFYDGLTFHAVARNFAVYAGDPLGDGNGGPGYKIRSEVNPRPFLRGTLAMEDHHKDSGGSRFFITQLPQPQLEGKYTVFGQVITGMDVVDRVLPGDIIREIVIWDGVTPPEEDSASGQP